MKKVGKIGEGSNYVGINLIKQSNLDINQRKIWKKWKNRGRGQIMSEYTKTKIYLRWRWKKFKKSRGRGQLMSEYTKTNENQGLRLKKSEKRGGGVKLCRNILKQPYLRINQRKIWNK